MPLCLEYVAYEGDKFIDDDATNEDKGNNDKSSSNKKKEECLLVGDDLGLITKYDFSQLDWHYCHFNQLPNRKILDNEKKETVFYEYCCSD